jgi:hypothetical protein
MKTLLYLYQKNVSFENGSPSPDGSGNPFVPGFGTKDWNVQREIAPKKEIPIF